MTMTESSSSELAVREELSKSQDVARQAMTDLEVSAERVSALESECLKCDSTADEIIRALEVQIQDLTVKLRKAEETLTAPSSPVIGSPTAQSDDDYIVVEPGSPTVLQNKLKEREAEIRKAIAHAKKLEDMYNTAEERTLNFEKQVQVLEANMFEKFDDANALLEKVKELEELLTAGQVQIAALEEKSKICDEAQKKVEYEKVLFLETEDQLVKNFKKAHDEAEQYRNMIFQLETSVKIAEEKAAHAEKFLGNSLQRSQYLESEIADLQHQLQYISRERSSYQSSKLKSDSELVELHKTLAMFQEKADFLDQELQMYRGREKSKVVDDDVRSVEEKNVVHEASSSHPGDTSPEVLHDHASGSDLGLDMAPESSLDDELKFPEEDVGAHGTPSELFMSKYETLQKALCEAEFSETQLKDHAKDLEEKVSQLDQEITILRESQQRMKDKIKDMEDKMKDMERRAVEESSLSEGMRMSYADYTSDLQTKNAKLDEELIVLRQQVAASVDDQEKLILYCERLKEAEDRNESLEARLANLHTELEASRESTSQLRSQMERMEEEMEKQLGELSIDLGLSRSREEKAQEDLKSLEDTSASHEQLASEWMEKCKSQVEDHNVRAQTFETRMQELEQENLQFQTSIKESRLWAERAAALLKEVAESLKDLREGYPDRSTTSKSVGKEVSEELQKKVEGLHLEFRGTQLCDGTEALQLCKELLFLERDCLNTQMLDVAYRNKNLESEVEDLKSQIQILQNPPEVPEKEVKKSFREVSLDGEVRSLRAQLVELQALRARVLEIPSLNAHLVQLQLTLRTAETRQHEQNLELAEVQRKVSKAEEEVCSLKSTLLNQTEFKEQVEVLEQKLRKAEELNASLKEEIRRSSKMDHGAEVTAIVTDEIVLEQASEQPQQQSAILLPQQSAKSKARRRKSKKSGIVPTVQETTQTADNSSSFRLRIAVFLISVLLVALVMRLSLR